jgi:hypothetical protein
MTAAQTQAPPQGAGAVFTTVMSTALDFAVAKVSGTADRWTDKLNEIARHGIEDGSEGVTELVDEAATSGGAAQQAGVRGVQAHLRGQNPVWAVVKGAWSGSNAAGKAAIVTALVGLLLMAVLSPVLLLVFLLSLLIVAAAGKAHSAKR